MKDSKAVRALCFVCAWLTLILGVIGIFVPVLPTTPFLLLSTFLFTRSSKRFLKWFTGTTLHNRYVVPFKEKGGLPRSEKIRILVISFSVMAVSAILVPVIAVWIILGLVSLWLLFLMFIRIPTIAKEQASETIEIQKKDES